MSFMWSLCPCRDGFSWLCDPVQTSGTHTELRVSYKIFANCKYQYQYWWGSRTRAVTVTSLLEEWKSESNTQTETTTCREGGLRPGSRFDWQLISRGGVGGATIDNRCHLNIYCIHQKHNHVILWELETKANDRSRDYLLAVWEARRWRGADGRLQHRVSIPSTLRWKSPSMPRGGSNARPLPPSPVNNGRTSALKTGRANSLLSLGSGNYLSSLMVPVETRKPVHRILFSEKQSGQLYLL